LKVLLDTHFLLWWLEDAGELGDKGRRVIANPENLIFVSAATMWELRIKEGIGKLELPQNFAEVVANEQFESLSVTARHTEALLGLPMHHRDPFDRMLVAQARVEGLTILTLDPFIPLYDVDTLSA